MNKLLIFTAPSGAGKTTIVRHLLEHFDSLAFSISATTRQKRAHEVDGKDYYFLSPEDFRQKIQESAFVEWEEVYKDQYYGTLKTEIQRLWELGKNIIFDIDVKGASNIKNIYPDQTLAIFVKPPSAEIILSRLKARKTETPESLKKRIARVKLELSYETRFDRILLNDKLDAALKEAEEMVREFLNAKARKKGKN